VARSLAEQVANARGIGPVTERNMPVFQAGVMTAKGIDPAQARTSRRYIPAAEVVVDRGYTRCTLVNNNRWELKWTRSSAQPENGFTVLATEPAESVEQLCDTYQRASDDERRLIRLLAEVSVESQQETPEPR
jgi:hypothetical protein